MNLFRRYKQMLNDTLNLQCDLCGKAYFTNFERILYCDDCIEQLEEEMRNGIPED